MDINGNLIVIGLGALAALQDLHREDAFADLRDDVLALREKVTERIGPKPDGTPWTDDDIRAIGARTRANLDRIDAQHATADGTGHP